MSLAPVAAASAVQFVMGAIWYGPLFGNTFVSLAYRHRQPRGSAAFGIIGSLSGAVVMSSVLYSALLIAKPATPEAAMRIAVVLAGLPAGTALTHTFWEGRPFALTLLHETYHCLVLVLNAWLLRRYFM